MTTTSDAPPTSLPSYSWTLMVVLLAVTAALLVVFAVRAAVAAHRRPGDAEAALSSRLAALVAVAMSGLAVLGAALFSSLGLL